MKSLLLLTYVTEEVFVVVAYHYKQDNNEIHIVGLRSKENVYKFSSRKVFPQNAIFNFPDLY